MTYRKAILLNVTAAVSMFFLLLPLLFCMITIANKSGINRIEDKRIELSTSYFFHAYNKSTGEIDFEGTRYDVLSLRFMGEKVQIVAATDHEETAFSGWYSSSGNNVKKSGPLIFNFLFFEEFHLDLNPFRYFISTIFPSLNKNKSGIHRFVFVPPEHLIHSLKVNS